jgi:hypothetical protein
MGPWTAWSRCSAACGGGTMERSRSCREHPAGVPCHAQVTKQQQECNLQPCPSECPGPETCPSISAGPTPWPKCVEWGDGEKGGWREPLSWTLPPICTIHRVPPWPGVQYLCHLMSKPLLTPAPWHHLCAGTLSAWLQLPWRAGEYSCWVLTPAWGRQVSGEAQDIDPRVTEPLTQLLYNGTCVPLIACPCIQHSLPWGLTLTPEEQAQELPSGTVLTQNCTSW